MKFETIEGRIAFWYGKHSGILSILPFLRNHPIEEVREIAEARAQRWRKVAESIIRDSTKEHPPWEQPDEKKPKSTDNNFELTARELMKKLVDYAESGAPIPFMQYMMEEWMETINEVEKSKNKIEAIESIDITPQRWIDIGPLADEAQELANQTDKQVFFEHQDIKCVALPGGSSTTLIKNYTTLRNNPESIFGPYAKSKT